MPVTTSVRPCEIRLAMMWSSAMRIGSCSGSSRQPMMMRQRSVTAPKAQDIASGEEMNRVLWCSDSHRSDRPCLSAQATCSSDT
jgi:hypothetical protein